jgi:hypothetical protein
MSSSLFALCLEAHHDASDDHHDEMVQSKMDDLLMTAHTFSR